MTRLKTLALDETDVDKNLTYSKKGANKHYTEKNAHNFENNYNTLHYIVITSVQTCLRHHKHNHNLVNPDESF